MNQFGTLLRFYRQRCVDAGAAKGRLTQARLGELVGEELGSGGGYTGAAVSEWERNRSQIHKDQRAVLLALIRILYEQGGLATAAEANGLLLAGNYRALDQAELQQIFPEIQDPDDEDPAPRFNKPDDLRRLVIILMAQLTYRPIDSLHQLQKEIGEGPPPHWPRFLLAVLGWPFNRWSSDDLLRMIAWIGVWALTCWFILPSLTWPFADGAAAQTAMLLYLTGALILPLFIGALTSTKHDPFWRKANVQSPLTLRLFTHQGAFVGFHVGYFFLLGAALIGYYLGFRHIPLWAQGAAVAGLLLISYAAARQTPLNLWRAFGDLRWRDGGVFFVFVGFGPVWAFFFLIYHPWLLGPYGAAFILAALAFLAALTSWQRRRSGSSVIPAHIWALLWAGVILPYTAVMTSPFPTVFLAAVMGVLIAALAYDRIQGTFWGMVAAATAVVLLLLLLQWNLWLGRAATIVIMLVWLWRGRGLFWLPGAFWGVILTGVSGLLLWQNGVLSENNAALLTGLVSLALIGWEWRK